MSLVQMVKEMREQIIQLGHTTKVFLKKKKTNLFSNSRFCRFLSQNNPTNYCVDKRIEINDILSSIVATLRQVRSIDVSRFRENRVRQTANRDENEHNDANHHIMTYIISSNSYAHIIYYNTIHSTVYPTGECSKSLTIRPQHEQ